MFYIFEKALPTFKLALAAAQLLADSQRLTVPICRQCDGDLTVIRFVDPRA